MAVQSTVRIIGVPMDLGAGRRGVDMGPSAIRAANLHARIADLGYKVQDGGNVFTVEPEERKPKDGKLKYVDEVLAACKDLADRVEKSRKENATPIVLGGDHSIAIGTNAGLSRKTKRRGLIWFDAHADFNTTETSPSGNIHGMPVSAILGLGHPRLADFDQKGPKLDAKNVVLIGLRSVDREEANVLNDSRVTYYTMRDVDEQGIAAIMDEALQRVGKGTDETHLSFDLDVVDPRWAPGTGTTVEGGLTYRESHLAMEILADSGVLGSLEFVEVNPLLDTGNTTGNFAAGLICSALGKAIVQDAPKRRAKRAQAVLS
jgi:arginase